MSDISHIINSPIMWGFVIAVFGIVILQAIVFMRISRNVSVEAGLQKSDTTTAVRVGAISAIGPSLAIAFVAIGLITVFGTPATIMRFGLVGSVPYELLAANIGAESLGVELNGAGFDGTAWATVFFLMAFGAGIWMLFVLLFTKSMGVMNEKLAKWNPVIMTIIPAAALLGAFSFLTINQLKSGMIPMVVGIISGLVMAALLFVSNKYKKSWLKEWALGISMFIGVGVAAFMV